MTKRIGITGGIATGKTTFLGLLKEMGFLTFSCDEVVEQLYKEPEVTKKVKELFGFSSDLDKIKILEAIVSDPGLKKRLEEVFHPRVKDRMLNFFREAEKKGEKVVFVEVPLLFECGWEKYFDEVWVITCSKTTQEKRIRERFPYCSLMMKLRDLQIPLEEKEKRAHRVFSSEKSIRELQEELKTCLKEFLKD